MDMDVAGAGKNNKGQEGMKRSTLIIADNELFRDWVACIITMRWPKMVIEYSSLASAPMRLDQMELERYQLIVADTGFHSFAEVHTCIFLMRILALESRPEIILISDDVQGLERAKSTKLGDAYCFAKGQATPAQFQSIFDDFTRKATEADEASADGAPLIPGYEIQYPLAATHTATIYRALDRRVNADVALKVCNSRPISYGNYHRLTLKQEYDVLRRLGGEYIACAYEYGEVEDLCYIAMEYFPNGCFGKFIKKHGRKVSRVAYLLQVAKALRSIHDAGFLHLDLKPSNVLVREDGSLGLIDFGISDRIVAAHHREQQLLSLGSPYFMSPEQARGEPLDVRSDIYSFGALWFRIFSGEVPFPGRTFEELRHAREHQMPSMGGVLRHYQPIVDKTLAPDREDRFETAQELVENIEHYTKAATGMYRCLNLKEIADLAITHNVPAFQ
jgi:hypothetical protein